MKRRLLLAALIAAVLLVLLGVGGVWFRRPLSWLMPIDHTGTVLRIAEFSKGGLTSRTEDTRQLRQFAIIFDDGFDCEGVDTSFAAVRALSVEQALPDPRPVDQRSEHRREFDDALEAVRPRGEGGLARARRADQPGQPGARR